MTLVVVEALEVTHLYQVVVVVAIHQRVELLVAHRVVVVAEDRVVVVAEDQVAVVALAF